MRELPQDLVAHLKSGVTTLCWCWKLTTRSGSVLGFTDHDRDVVFDNVIYEAATGFNASEVQESVGLNVDNLEVTGAITSDRLTEEHLAAGVYDDAQVDIYRVNWSNVDARVLLRSASLGEVTNAGNLFSAEVRGLSHYLQQKKGRVFQYQCDADLGDGRCGVSLSGSTFKASGNILEINSDRRFTVDGLSGYERGWFNRGLFSLAGASFGGFSSEVKAHGKADGDVWIELWSPAPSSIEIGSTFSVTAGCDKTIQTCRQKFSNALNYRGFPDMPGNDFVTSFARVTDR